MKQVFHQGDVQAFQIEQIPANAKKIEKQFLAESERSNSFHALFGNYDQYECEDGSIILDVKEECILNHSLKQHLNGLTMNEHKILTKKDHRHTVVAPGIYQIGIQQRFDPLAGMKVKVKD